MDKRDEIIEMLLEYPIEFANMLELGAKKFTDMHNEWAVRMITGTGDRTLLAHRNSWKTTILSVAISVVMILFPNESNLFLRKTDSDVKEVIEQVKKILNHDITQSIAEIIYGNKLILKSNIFEINTSFVTRTTGTPQLLGMGINANLTGKHFNRIWTDDICGPLDRESRSEREKTKRRYMELQNIKIQGTGSIHNTSTIWASNDCVMELMPNKLKYDCYTTGMMNDEEIELTRKSMTPTLFAANYELKIVASDECLFATPPEFTSDITKIFNATPQIDASFGGGDYNALTLLKKHDDKIYILGKLRKGHIFDHLFEFIDIVKKYNGTAIHTEANADKGIVAKEIKNRGGNAKKPYHENAPKSTKISGFIRSYWDNIIFIDGTDDEYLLQIQEWHEEAEHDDAPDSLASSLRIMENKKGIFFTSNIKI